MNNRFTDRARKVLQLANQEAQRLNHEYVGTEHILLGLIKEGTGVAARVFASLNVDLRKTRPGVTGITMSLRSIFFSVSCAKQRVRPSRSSGICA
jgi:ATP-dependent Clp protease ATP-binding subunit ClpC